MSLADKLNYTIAAKLDVQQACIYQGVDLPDNAPFGDYGKYIRLLVVLFLGMVHLLF